MHCTKTPHSWMRHKDHRLMNASETPHTHECIAQMNGCIAQTHGCIAPSFAFETCPEALNTCHLMSLWCQHGFKGFFVLSEMVLQCCCSVVAVCCIGLQCAAVQHTVLSRNLEYVVKSWWSQRPHDIHYLRLSQSFGPKIPDLLSWTFSSGTMGWLQLVGSLKWQVSFAEYRLFCRALLQRRPIILRSLLIVAATP